MLSHPDYSKPFKLRTDASDRAIGFVLTQRTNFFGFHNTKLTAVQQKYSVVEKELLEIIKALEFFKNIVYNAPITVLTDNRNHHIQKSI